MEKILLACLDMAQKGTSPGGGSTMGITALCCDSTPLHLCAPLLL